MRGNPDVGATSAELLALAQQRGRAQKALTIFTNQAVTIVRNTTAKTASSAALSLLNAAVERRQPEWTRALTEERDPKRQRVGSSSRNDAVFAAKLAQSVVKGYASTNGATVKAGELEDLVTAMDLACVALYVVCVLEHAVRLGDLVVDNLLYQVAKKYAEIPNMVESASCVAACVHVRLWNAHAQLCNESGEIKSQLMQLLDLQGGGGVALADKVVKNLTFLAEFPQPRDCHTASFARLLLGHTNTCVSLLTAVKNHEVVLQVAETTLSPWIDHLQKHHGQDSKLASSFSDRTFRILWKCAAAMDGAQQNSSETASAALRFRSAALLFLLKCSNYTSSYFIQQIHRVGVQHERASKKSLLGFQELYALYTRSAGALSRTVPGSTHIYTSDSFQWEYIHWLEHFAMICDASGKQLTSALIMENAAQYVRLFGQTKEPIQLSLLFTIAGALFGLAGSSNGEISACCGFEEKLASGTGRLLRDLVRCTSSDKWVDLCEKAARVCLKKLEALAACSFASLGQQNYSKFVPFLVRCLKRSSTKVFNYTIGIQHSAKYQLYHQIVTSFSKMSTAVKELRSVLTDRKIIETLILEESRLHRMAVMLSVRCCITDSPSGLRSISHHVKLVRELLDDTTLDGKPSKLILHGVLGDLNSIARECYNCATRCFKAGSYQDTVLALIGAFELAESYLEYVMCSNLAAEDVQKAHVQLKVDIIVTLLAHCFRELGDITKARIFTGYSILYCGDIYERIPKASVDKYVACLLEELKLFKDDTQPSIANDFTSFVDNAMHVFKSRQVPEDQIMALWSAFRYAFERTSVKTVESARTRDCVETEDTFGILSEIRLCGTLERHLNGVLMKLKTNDGESFDNILLDVFQSLAERKQIYCTYYCTRDFNDAIKELLQLHHSLSAAAENIQCSADTYAMDLGGIYGWRGVITMEVALMISYAPPSEGVDTREHGSIDEESALADIERCLMYWNGGEACGYLFDRLYVMCCLASVCNTLSLISYSPMEEAARNLLKTLQMCASDEDITSIIIPPPILSLLHTNAKGKVSIVKMDGGNSATIMLEQFEQVDKELYAAETSHLDDIRGDACQHLVNAITTLGDIKLSMKQRPTATISKAMGMRELCVHTILSEIYFHEGRSKRAIAEAKAALRICWRLAKKFTATSSSADAAFFGLPPEISTVEYQQRKSAHLLYFLALECSSWDLLLAAKLSLCRIASLYSLSDQPHRAASYLTEAMRLVGGLDLDFFPRGPFYEYAELELNASHLKKAKVAISLLSSRSDTHTIDATGAVASHPSQSDLAVIEQKCNEIVQRGDVHLSEGAQQAALSCYSEAIGALSVTKNCDPSVSKRLGRVRARCWRKYTQLQSQSSDFSDLSAVETLLVSMKKLKQMMKDCNVHLERVKCMLELGRINTRLLRSASPRAFSSLNRTHALLEEAYLLGDHLGVPHLSQDLRTALGMAYFAEIEENASDEFDSMDGDDRTNFLSWSSSILLANAGSADVAEREITSLDTDTDTSAQEALTKQLNLFAGNRAKSREQSSYQQQVYQMSKSVQQLPDNWVIVSLMIGLSSELVISRILTNGSAPISFSLPRVTWAKCTCEMDAIIQESRENLSGHTAEEAGCWTTKQKKEWWKTRSVLDERIEKAISSMQETLGFWRCLLVGGPPTKNTLNVQRCWDLLIASKTGPVKLAERNKSLLSAIADAEQCLTDSEVIDGLSHIAAEIGVAISDSVTREALQVLRMKCEIPGSTSLNATQSKLAKLSMGQISKLKVGEVKRLLAAEGLSADGLKKTLIERLIGARNAAFVDKLKSTTQRGHGGVNCEFSTILILNHQLQQFPWEGMDVMGLCSGVTRMPCLDLIVQNAKRLSPVRRGRVRFLLNPAGDLKSTQNHLGPILEGGATTYGWEGIVGEVPDPDELKNYLLASDLYIYCGHGSGEAYLHRDEVLGLQSDCSAALLFGCSSGRLEREGIFGPSGAVLSYLRAGSPAVLAMLWDVTDRDIDQLSVKVLQEWLLADNEDTSTSPSLAQVLQNSRDVCKLKYLNGHAAVCYGLPLYVVTS